MYSAYFLGLLTGRIGQIFILNDLAYQLLAFKYTNPLANRYDIGQFGFELAIICRLSDDLLAKSKNNGSVF